MQFQLVPITKMAWRPRIQRTKTPLTNMHIYKWHMCLGSYWKNYEADQEVGRLAGRLLAGYLVGLLGWLVGLVGWLVGW